MKIIFLYKNVEKIKIIIKKLIFLKFKIYIHLMPTFLAEVDGIFNEMLKQPAITKKDLIKLKLCIMDAYENDNVSEVKSIFNSMKKLDMDF
jgi:hypothetical protein|uniref:Uncharacterized protein n=1 Tax=viral metagenome TaxID=1070528 RepID=A0A6C0DLB5_9ZZZZ